MTPELNQYFSLCRLKKYRKNGETSEQGFARYQWNIQLGEALLPALSYFELGLRSGVDRAITVIYSRNWLLNPPDKLKLNQSDLDQISRHKDEIRNDKGWEASHDDIVAKLGFGFWGAFFQKRYDPVLWQHGKTLVTIFPNMQRALRTRKYIAPKLHTIRTMRNRIAHHEPIWHLSPDVQAVHQTCLEMIHAMSIPAAQALTQIDRFTEIYARGIRTTEVL